MTFEQWSGLLTTRLRAQFPHLSVLPRHPGLCYVNGIAALDLIELQYGTARIVRHKDPLVLRDGQLIGRHKGVVLEPREFALDDEDFLHALACMREHLAG